MNLRLKFIEIPNYSCDWSFYGDNFSKMAENSDYPILDDGITSTKTMHKTVVTNSL